MKMEANTIQTMESNTIQTMESNTIVEMEAKPTLKIPYPLNLDCLYTMFEWFGFKDCMHFAEAYHGSQCVADYMYKRKFTEFDFDFEDPIDRVFYQIGPFVKSLTLILDKFDLTEKHLKDIRDSCEKLQSLTLKGFDRRRIQSNPFCGETDNLEVLTLNRCSLANDVDFFKTFTNLKCLNLRQCREIENVALFKCFKNNKMLKSFVCDGHYGFFPQLLTLLPNLEHLDLQYSTTFTSQTFSNFHELRFLTLRCWGQNINDILSELAKKNNLEQLVIKDAQMDENTFNIINTFQKLELLVVTTREYEFTSAHTLSPKLRYLKLGGFRISQQQITSLFKQLIHLEDIHLNDCILDNNGVLAMDFVSMTELIVKALYIQSQGNRQLNVILTHFGRNTYKVAVTTDRLRICNYLETSSAFQIKYPGMVD